MCGIGGLVGRRPGAVALSALAGFPAMMGALTHRGPDDSGEYHERGVALGFRRLAIVDLQHGNQPLASEDGRIVSVLNGELYNHRELRRDLEARGHRFRTASDAEVLPHLYEAWGIDGVARLRGMYAAALWDSREKVLYLVRDPFGIKPLYYAEIPEGLVFASEVQAILASGLVDPAVDATGLWHYFTFQYVPDPLTPVRGVRRVPPGHYLEYRHGRLALRRYWAPAFRPEAQSAEAVDEAIVAALGDSVRAHLMADVPVGAYLSSGVDSALLVAFMREAMAELHTFSVSFEGAAPGMDEGALAAAVANRFGTHHHTVRIRARDYGDHFAAIVRAQDEPLGDPSAPALWFLGREARQHVKVVLSGEGADELFGGYPVYREPNALKPFTWLPPSIRRGLWRLGQRWPEGVPGGGLLVRQATPLPHRFVGNARLLSETEKAALLPDVPEDARQPAHELLSPLYEAHADLDPVAQMQLVDMLFWLPGDILMKADKMAMAHSLENRVPYLDPAVFAVAASLPAGFRVRGRWTKVALRRAALRLLPREIAYRPKLGFPVPFLSWVSGPLRDYTEALLADVPPEIHPETAKQYLFPNHGHTKLSARKAWALFAYLAWRRGLKEASLAAPQSRP